MNKPVVTVLEEGFIVFGNFTKDEAFEAIKDYERKECGLTDENEGIGEDWLYWCEKISSRKESWIDEDGKSHWDRGMVRYNMREGNKKGRPGWYVIF